MGHNFRDPEVSQLDKQLPSKNSRNYIQMSLISTPYGYRRDKNKM